MIIFSASGTHLKSTPPQGGVVTLLSAKGGKTLETQENTTEEQEAMRRTAFGKAFYDMSHSERVMDDLTFGRRVGLYELRGQIGCGNFSQVRLGIHDLTKGEVSFTAPVVS